MQRYRPPSCQCFVTYFMSFCKVDGALILGKVEALVLGLWYVFTAVAVPAPKTKPKPKLWIIPRQAERRKIRQVCQYVCFTKKNIFMKRFLLSGIPKMKVLEMKGVPGHVFQVPFVSWGGQFQVVFPDIWDMECEVWAGSGITMQLKWIRFSTIIFNTFYMSCCCEKVKTMTRRDLITFMIDT